MIASRVENALTTVRYIDLLLFVVPVRAAGIADTYRRRIRG
jgi:hypothetical protein